jgi:hypothetical protein
VEGFIEKRTKKNDDPMMSEKVRNIPYLADTL